MDDRPSQTALLMTVLLCACECGDGQAPQRNAQRNTSSATHGEGAGIRLPPPEGTPVAAEDLVTYAPEAFFGFTATEPVQRRNSPLPNGGTLTSVRRSYKRDEQTLQLEVTDTQHALAVRELVTQQQGQDRKSEQSEFKGTTVAGHPALVQWHGSNDTAIVNMLVGDRFMVNVKVSPVESPETAVGAASALPVAELVKLAGAADPPPADEAAPAAEPEGAPAPQDAPSP
jgi:hypothetical protein